MDDLKKRVEEVNNKSYPLKFYNEVLLIKDLGKAVKDLTEREAKLTSALKEIANSEECHELWYRTIAFDALKSLGINTNGDVSTTRNDIWNDHYNTGMRYPEESDLIGGKTDCEGHHQPRE